ncbi:MAG: shikimate kinase, partial [Candidatus Nanopelagicaceae bacterium]
MFAPKRIRGCILIGPPGAGKSTVGGQIARDLGLPFLDTDIIIEESTGKKVSQIFIEDGEAKFREIEESVVLKSI